MSGRTAGARRPANGGVDKPWASGRILTPEQRARKQEADRKANRFLKKEVQDRLTLLEARVLELEKNPPSGPGDSTSEAKNGDSKIQFPVGPTGIGRATNGGATQGPSKDMGWNSTVSYQNGPTTSEAGHVDILESPAISSSGEAYFSTCGPQMGPPSTFSNSNADGLPTDPTQSVSGVPPDFTDVTTTARTRPDGRHMTCFLNNLVNYIRTMAPSIICFDDQYNQDLIVTSIMKGWEPTLARYQQRCPLWEVLRLVDTYLFKDCNFVERISALRMLHRRYLYEVNANLPTAGPPPPWFRPQFSEKVFFHDPVIDHLTWPRLRQRLIASEQDKMTNKFWALFVKNLRVTWRYEPIDIMTFSSETQLYQLTPLFENAIMDITHWRMDMDFFRGIPQLAGDVPPYNYMPLQTVTPKLGPTGARRTLSPRFGLHHEQQDQSVQSVQQIQQVQQVQQVEEGVPEDTWMQHPHLQPGPAFPDSNPLGVVKMSPSMWNNFYS